MTMTTAELLARAMRQGESDQEELGYYQLIAIRLLEMLASEGFVIGPCPVHHAPALSRPDICAVLMPTELSREAVRDLLMPGLAGMETRYTGLAQLRSEGGSTQFDEGAGPSVPFVPIGPPLYPPESPAARWHWLRDIDGELVIVEWDRDTTLQDWLFPGDDVPRTPAELGAHGYTYHSAVIVPEA